MKASKWHKKKPESFGKNILVFISSAPNHPISFCRRSGEEDIIDIELIRPKADADGTPGLQNARK